jgi:hypothetical protein
MKHFLLPALLCLAFTATAQMDEEDAWAWGLKGGYAYSTLEDAVNTVLPLPLRAVERPHTDELWQNGYTASFFLHKRLEKRPFVFQLEGFVNKLGGRLKTNIPADSFHVDNHFRYTYAGITPFINWHPALPADARDAQGKFFTGFHMGVGLNYSFVVKEEITYESHQPEFDPGTIRRMKDELEAKSHFNLLVGIGYEYFWEKSNFGICFDTRFSYGLGDAIKTNESTLYQETDVRSQAWLITLGFFAPFSR